MMLTDAGASLGFCSYFEAPKIDGRSSNRIISSPPAVLRTEAAFAWSAPSTGGAPRARRSEEHTSELQSQSNLVCRLLLEKKKNYMRSSRELCHPGIPR